MKERKQTPLISMLEDIIREQVDLRTPDVIRKEIGAALDGHRAEIGQVIDTYLEKKLDEAVSVRVVAELDRQLGLGARAAKRGPAETPDGAQAESLKTDRCPKCDMKLTADGRHWGGKKCKAKA